MTDEKKKEYLLSIKNNEYSKSKVIMKHSKGKTSILSMQSPLTPSKRKKDNNERLLAAPATPALQSSPSADEERDVKEESQTKSSPRRKYSVKKRLYFGHNISSSSSQDSIQENTRKVYTVVNKITGATGGGGCGGAIYGELTLGSMQKMVDLMKVHTNFGQGSRFIDVGSGLGKPNLHVTQDPGVEFSYGIEMEHVRWVLGMSNLNMVLQHAKKYPDQNIQHRCMFQHGDITEAKYFDPFTHVYMFDIGFPPKLFHQLSEMFNRSHSPYLICYHGPKLIIDRYGFNVELIVQTPTSMHGSSEVHTGYLYRRSQGLSSSSSMKRKTSSSKKSYDTRVVLDEMKNIISDPLFVNAWKSTRRELEPVLEDVKSQVTSTLSSQRPRRSRKVSLS